MNKGKGFAERDWPEPKPQKDVKGYTKGEWKARQWFTSEGVEGYTIEVNGIPIARDVSSANAHLIAAAPELYEACKNALPLAEDYQPGLEKQIRQAIAKVEGG